MSWSSNVEAYLATLIPLPPVITVVTLVSARTTQALAIAVVFRDVSPSNPRVSSDQFIILQLFNTEVLVDCEPKPN
jgi:hypothetical protein